MMVQPPRMMSIAMMWKVLVGHVVVAADAAAAVVVEWI